MNQPSSATEPLRPPESHQFTIASTFWMMTAAAMLLAHASRLGTASTQLLAACALFWVASAVVFSAISRRPTDVLFWSALMTTDAFLAISAVRVFGFSQACGWGLVGAVCGAFCGARLLSTQWVGAIISGALGATSMALVLCYFREAMHLELWMDVIGAACVGLVLWYFIEFLKWFQTTSQQSRLVLAAWLTISVLAGNWLVTYYGF